MLAIARILRTGAQVSLFCFDEPTEGFGTVMSSRSGAHQGRLKTKVSHRSGWSRTSVLRPFCRRPALRCGSGEGRLT